MFVDKIQTQGLMSWLDNFLQRCGSLLNIKIEEAEEGDIPEDLPSVEAASRASAMQKIAFGERRGQRVRRVGFRREGDVVEFKGPQGIA